MKKVLLMLADWHKNLIVARFGALRGKEEIKTGRIEKRVANA